MTREDELALLRRAQGGDLAAFEEIVRVHEKVVYHMALQTLGNREDAEDAAQDVFLKAYTSLKSFRGDSKISVWLYRITNNVCIDMLRRRKDAVSLSGDDGEEGGEVELPDDSCDPADLAQRRDLQERLAAALQHLPQDQREAFLMRAVAELSYDEIAQTLGLDLGTVKSRIFRARKKLCEILEKNGNFSPSAASKKKEGGVKA